MFSKTFPKNNIVLPLRKNNIFGLISQRKPQLADYIDVIQKNMLNVRLAIRHAIANQAQLTSSTKWPEIEIEVILLRELLKKL